MSLCRFLTPHFLSEFTNCCQLLGFLKDEAICCECPCTNSPGLVSIPLSPSVPIRMDRIKMRQQKFKRGKEKMLSMTQESGEGQNLVPPEEEDDGTMKAVTTAPLVTV